MISIKYRKDKNTKTWIFFWLEPQKRVEFTPIRSLAHPKVGRAPWGEPRMFKSKISAGKALAPLSRNETSSSLPKECCVKKSECPIAGQLTFLYAL